MAASTPAPARSSANKALSSAQRIDQTILDVLAQLPKLPLTPQQTMVLSGLSAALGLGLDAGVISQLTIQVIVGVAAILWPLGLLIYHAVVSHAQAKVAASAIHAHVIANPPATRHTVGASGDVAALVKAVGDELAQRVRLRDSSTAATRSGSSRRSRSAGSSSSKAGEKK